MIIVPGLPQVISTPPVSCFLNSSFGSVLPGAFGCKICVWGNDCRVYGRHSGFGVGFICCFSSLAKNSDITCAHVREFLGVAQPVAKIAKEITASRVAAFSALPIWLMFYPFSSSGCSVSKPGGKTSPAKSCFK